MFKREAIAPAPPLSATPAAEAASARNASLDTLRGLAILFVLIGHYMKDAPYHIAGAPVEQWFVDFGQGGVLLFFMLSGYLIWKTGNRNPAPVFLLRRLAKIVPAYWVNVLLVGLAGALLPIFPAFALKDVLGNLAFLEGSMGIAALSGVYWTLVIEVKFYLLFTLVFYSPLRRLFWLIPVAALAVNLLANWLLGRPSTFLTYLPVFFIGAALAALPQLALARLMAPAAMLAAMAGLWLLAPHRGWQAAVFLAMDVGLFIAVSRSGFSIVWLSWLGVISYSVYLYHTTLGFPLLEAFSPLFGPRWPLLMVLILVAVGLASILSYRAIELPFVRYAHRFGKN